MLNESQKYNGWTNYETALCNLHYDDFFTKQAKECWNAAKADDTFSREENAALALKDNIESAIEELTQESLAGGAQNAFVNDLVYSALCEVNYYEIAKRYIESCDKESEAD